MENVQAKLDNFMRGVRGEKMDYVPIMMDFEPTYICEYTKQDCIRSFWDYDGFIKGYEQVMKDFDIDLTQSVVFLPPQKNALLGSKVWVQNRVNGYMQHPEVTSLLPEEYPELIEDPIHCIASRVLPRMYTELGREAPYSTMAFAKALLYEKNQVHHFYDQIFEKTMANDALLYYGTMFYAPFDLLADHLRGITQISMDLRRRKDDVEAACDALLNVMARYVETTSMADESGFPLACTWSHLPPMINQKQFERFYWPTFKKLCEMLTAKGVTLYVNFQGDYRDGRFFDFYQELPKDKIVIAVEYQDFDQATATLGQDHMLSCSYPLNYFSDYSTEECIDKARELMDIGMKNGRFYFGLNKSALDFHDADPDKLKAVLNFVREYGQY